MAITNPDKVMFPERDYRKWHVVDYYGQVADRMLPWLDGRPLTLERHPNGVAEKGFMQKNASSHFSDHIERVTVPKADGKVTHPVVRDVEGLTELANQGTISFHVWTAAVPDLDHPTHLVLDLDPEADDTDTVRLIAERARVLLARFDLDGLLVASGKKGFHIWVAVEGSDYEEVGSASRAIAGLIALENPDHATVEFLKKKRRGRVFVDWLRNRRAQSIVCPWSLRVTPTATVAMPLEWDELSATSPDAWDLSTAVERRAVTPPDPVRLDLDAIAGAAREAGVDLDAEFDRFGRS